MADASFLYQWTPVDSSWVGAIAYVIKGKRAGIAVAFLDGFTCWYPGTDTGQYKNMKRAKSKGKWVWKKLYDLEYDEL